MIFVLLVYRPDFCRNGRFVLTRKAGDIFDEVYENGELIKQVQATFGSSPAANIGVISPSAARRSSVEGVAPAAAVQVAISDLKDV